MVELGHLGHARAIPAAGRCEYAYSRLGVVGVLGELVLGVEVAFSVATTVALGSCPRSSGVVSQAPAKTTKPPMTDVMTEGRYRVWTRDASRYSARADTARIRTSSGALMSCTMSVIALTGSRLESNTGKCASPAPTCSSAGVALLLRRSSCIRSPASSRLIDSRRSRRASRIAEMRSRVHPKAYAQLRTMRTTDQAGISETASGTVAAYRIMAVKSTMLTQYTALSPIPSLFRLGNSSSSLPMAILAHRLLPRISEEWRSRRRVCPTQESPSTAQSSCRTGRRQ